LKNSGVWFALGCYGVWGVFPIYWKLLSSVSYLHVMGHRILWSAVFLGAFLCFKQGFQNLKDLIQKNTQDLWKVLIPSALLIGFNWTLYIYCISENLILESSLGYFINPLMNIFFGRLLLGETLNRLQWASVLCACVGVGVMVFGFGRLPYFALLLATSFSLYGLVRKKASGRFSPLFGTTVECFYLLPVAVLFLSTPNSVSQEAAFFSWNWNTLLLVIAGVITAMPLVWFSEAAKRLPYSTMGFFQFIAPTLQFLSAIFLFHENLSQLKLLGFCFIWAGGILFIFEKLKNRTPKTSS
jgi:chloramphenicol-sensitive protein RarD